MGGAKSRGIIETKGSTGQLAASWPAGIPPAPAGMIAGATATGRKSAPLPQITLDPRRRARYMSYRV